MRRSELKRRIPLKPGKGLARGTSIPAVSDRRRRRDHTTVLHGIRRMEGVA